MRGVTHRGGQDREGQGFLLTRPMRGVTPLWDLQVDQDHFYSHAPCGA